MSFGALTGNATRAARLGGITYGIGLQQQVGTTNLPLIHIMSPAGELQHVVFSAFVRPFSADADEALIVAGWIGWQKWLRIG